MRNHMVLVINCCNISEEVGGMAILRVRKDVNYSFLGGKAARTRR